MKIGLIGAGAMGSLLGGHLALGGQDVTLIDVDADHLSAINENGLPFEFLKADRKAAEDLVRIANTPKSEYKPQ
jgi:ketopantoate reductase